jgi:predicted transposase YbfD/YdcC
MSQGFENKSTNAQKSFPTEKKLTEAVDIGAIQQSLVQHFQGIKDPRVERTKKHQLTDILVMAILAVIAGAQGWEDIENYGISKQLWLAEFLELPNGIPSDDTFRRVFEFINPRELNRCFFQWVETLVKKMAGEVIPIDGKTIRGSYDRSQGKSALHVISAWSSEQRLVLGQLKVAAKSNEITAIPALLELLDITDSIITIDAMGTQTEIAQKIIDKKGNYVLALKANHPTLYSQVSQWSHWVLDCTFAEDSCRIRSFHSPSNFAILRRLALNVLNREPTYQRSLRQKMKRTAMDNDYMIQVLSSSFLDSPLDSFHSLCQA